MNVLAPRMAKMTATLNSAAQQLSVEVQSLSEADTLSKNWASDDIRLREDARFRRTPWGRWILASQFLANDLAYQAFIEEGSAVRDLDEMLQEFSGLVGRQCVLCSGDSRLVVRDGKVRLATSELSAVPEVEEATDLEQFVTHLPLYTLQAAAASDPGGEWGPAASEQSIDTLGWMSVNLPESPLNDRMFVARIQGHSMDDGRSGLRDLAYAVFEFWPKGTRQEKTVLVRGAFTDPETGSYAVKKYVADERDEQGEHRRITLVSLNSDKERYPDIILTPESDDDLAVVASCITALQPDQYQRRPKLPASRRRRDLTSDEGRERIAQRLSKAASRVFDGQPETTGEDGKEIQPNARFVCFDWEGGGLHVETTPLEQLPSFVKKLQVSTNGQSQTVLASNLRNRVWRTPIIASSVGYRWSAPGFESELDEDLANWNLPGLESEVATAFRIDASGVGRHVASPTLTLAKAYRVLLPPGLETMELPEGQALPLNDGWRLWEFELPSTLTSPWRKQLERLGLTIGKSAPNVQWVLNPPVSYFTASSGERYPVFSPDFSPAARIEGLPTNVEGECTAFVLAGEELIPMMLPPGDEWTLELNGLIEGRYVLEVTHRRTRVEAVRLPFVVSLDSGPLVSSTIQLRIDDQVTVPNDSGFAILESDLTNFNAEGDCEIRGPSLWPLAQFWDSETRRYLDTSYVDSLGNVDVESLAERSRESRQRNRIGNLILDFSELGHFELRHTRRDDPNELLTDLAAATTSKASNVEAMSGQFQLLRSMWIDSLLERLGYQVSDVEEQLLEFSPPGVSAVLLYERSRSGSEITKRLFAPLILTSTSTDWDSFDAGSVRAYADLLCERVGVREAFVTDGLRWTRHRQGKRVHARVWDLRELGTDEEAKSQFEHFLFDFAAGV